MSFERPSAPELTASAPDSRTANQGYLDSPSTIDIAEWSTRPGHDNNLHSRKQNRPSSIIFWIYLVNCFQAGYGIRWNQLREISTQGINYDDLDGNEDLSDGNCPIICAFLLWRNNQPPGRKQSHDCVRSFASPSAAGIKRNCSWLQRIGTYFTPLLLCGRTRDFFLAISTCYVVDLIPE